MEMTADYRIDYDPNHGDCLVRFFCGGKYDFDVRGSFGTGMKHYPTFKQAKAAGERYLKKMAALGFKPLR